MLRDGSLTFQEYLIHEPLPLATIQDALLSFLRGRDDAVLTGAQAVTVYVDEPRMTQDVDILSPRAEALAEEIKDHLHKKFHIAILVRKVKEGIGYRIYQMRKPKNRDLGDVRSIDSMPSTQRVEEILVLTPMELIASKVIALTQRKGRPKSGSDWRDLAKLLLLFPDLKTASGPIRERLEAAMSAGADQSVLDTWRNLVDEEILPEDEDADF